MKVFFQVFAAVFLATGITLGSFAWFINQQVTDFKLTLTTSVSSVNTTINKSVLTLSTTIKNFKVFGR